mgnify:CR=1 FL=1
MARNFNFDLTEDEFNKEGGFELVPEGRYDVEVVEVDEAESKAGNTGYKFKLKALNGEFSGLLFFDLWITPKTIGNSVKKTIKAAGITPVPTATDLSIPEPEDFVGTEFNVDVTHEDWESQDGSKKGTAARVNPFDIQPVGGSGGAKKSAGGGFDL